jgi:hypothetical protein
MIAGRRDQGASLSLETIRAAQARLRQRLQVLDANAADRQREMGLPDLWEDERALRWLKEGEEDEAKDKEGGEGGVKREVLEESVYVFLSSAMRDPVRDPNAAEFRVRLAKEVTNVVRAELVQASIPLVDPTVHERNNTLRYAFAPFTGAAVREVRIPPGSYLGAALAAEITRQLNQDVHAAQVLSGAYEVDPDSGLVKDPATGLPPGGVGQFRVNWNVSRQMLAAQWVSDALVPVDSAPFALHFRRYDSSRAADREVYDDPPALLGFNRIAFDAEAVALGQVDPAHGTCYLLNTGTSAAFNGLFGEAVCADTRWRHSLHSDQAADLRGSTAVVLDIDPLNGSDTALVADEDGASALPIGTYFGFLLVRDPATVADRMYELTNNSFPIKKSYRAGRSRVGHLTVRLRRPDGTVLDLGGVNFHLTLRLTTWKVDSPRPVFARGN